MLAYPVADSPGGLIGWNGQPLAGGGDVEAIDIEFALTNLVICWFARARALLARLHHEDAHADASAEPAAVSVGFASVAGAFDSIRRFVGRDHKNVVSWHECAVGGRCVTHQVPDFLVVEVLGCYGALLIDRVGA